ncbi:MAG TPA: hypothetical protein VNR70_13540 [Steroidobacteraceae bacterium]|nr:hypothetical protein [Steroidobacteraceae bacterium]
MVVLTVDAEAAQALESPAHRAAAGRYLSGLLKGGCARDLLREAIGEAKSEARTRPLTQTLTPSLMLGGHSQKSDRLSRRVDLRLRRSEIRQRPGATCAIRTLI